MSKLPESVVDEVERLTRLGRAAVDEDERRAYRDERASLLEEYGFTARVREEDRNEVLVCYPAEWVEEGVVRIERVDDTDRAVERRLTGPGDPEDWETIAAHNDRVVERVAESHGPTHGATARAFADFMSNHYARRIETATGEERTEFREEYFVRNAWPSDEQKAVLETSLSLVLDAARDASDETTE